MLAERGEFGANLNPVRIVHVKKRRGGAPDDRHADYAMLHERKVLAPGVGPGVEQPRDLVSGRIDRGKIRPLAGITAPARQRQVFRIVGSAVLTCANMLNVKTGLRQGILWNTAILAPMCGALPHNLADRFVHD